MNSSPPLARRASQVLVEDAREDSPRTDADRARTIEAIAATMRAKARRRRRDRWILSAGAIAAAALCAIGAAEWRVRSIPAQSAQGSPSNPGGASSAVGAVAQFVDGSVLVIRGGQTDRLTEARSVKVGDHVVALQDGRASLTLPSRTRIAVEGGTDVALLEQGQMQLLGLSAGAIRADVTKLAKGERFIVRTSDAEVEVRGTSFRVSQAPSDPACGAGTTTRVTVYEGVVLVRSSSTESSVSAGEAWPRGCAGSAISAASSVPLAAASPVNAVPGSKDPPSAPRAPVLFAQPSGPPASADVKRSQLAAQNDLFDESMAAKRRGDTSAALAGFERFLVRYPSSPLTEHAAVERMRLLSTMDTARAAAAAKDYLARYPGGFARADAEAILITQL